MKAVGTTKNQCRNKMAECRNGRQNTKIENT
jgi:hypothetical protein